MNTNKEISEVAEQIIELINQLDTPKDAACAILIAHVKLTLDHGLNANVTVDQMLANYASAFKDAYSG